MHWYVGSPQHTLELDASLKLRRRGSKIVERNVKLRELGGCKSK
jgi:hypothetical protein